MTGFATTVTPQSDQPYALFSPEAREAQRQVVVGAAPPPLASAPIIIRKVELRERPFMHVYEKLETLSSLEEDWDSYGAATISASALRTARAILGDLSLRPAAFGSKSLVPFSLAPVANGGIKLEWRRADAAVELWVDADGQIEIVIDRPQSEPRFEKKTASGIPAAIHEVLAFVD